MATDDHPTMTPAFMRLLARELLVFYGIDLEACERLLDKEDADTSTYVASDLLYWPDDRRTETHS